MSTKLSSFVTSILLLTVACDGKKPISQELCERQTNRADCEAAGCTYTCGMVLVETAQHDQRCLARRRVGRCLAVVKLVDNAINNQDYYYSVGSGETGWFRDRAIYRTIDGTRLSFNDFFKIKNPHRYRVEVLGHRPFVMDIEEPSDPCTQFDPEGTLFPWEGSCETDWWSEAMWDDVLAL